MFQKCKKSRNKTYWMLLSSSSQTFLLVSVIYSPVESVGSDSTALPLDLLSVHIVRFSGKESYTQRSLLWSVGLISSNNNNNNR